MTRVLTNVETWTPMVLYSRYFGAHFEDQQVDVLSADGTPRALGAWPGAAVDPAFWRRVWEDLDCRGVNKISLACASHVDARTLCLAAKVLPPFRLIQGEGHTPAASSIGVLRADARRAVREACFRAARIALEHLLAGSGAGRAAVLSPDWFEVLEQLRPFYALLPHCRAFLRAGEEYLEQLGHRLSHSVGRHGPFANLTAAFSFAARPISRYELRLKFSKLSAARPALSLAGSNAVGVASLGR